MPQVFATAQAATGVGVDIVVAPGRGASAGAHYAFQPEYRLGTRGSHRAFSSFMIDPRTYLGGHGMLLRMEAATGRERSPRPRGQPDALVFLDPGPEISTSLVAYKVLRAGVFLHANRGRLRREIGYERDIAGRGIHVAQHVVLRMGFGF